MRRREFLRAALATSLGWSAPALGQQPNRTYRIGVLSTSRRTADINVAFVDGLNKLGFVEGQNLTILDLGFGKSRDDFAGVAREFVEARVDAIVAMSGAVAIRAAQAATQSIPIFGIADDMVLEGHVHSIANHGGNTTGLSLLAAQLDGKRQEILMELLPNARRMATIFDADVQLAGQMKELHDAAGARSVELFDYPVRKPEEVAPAMEACKAAGAEAVNFLASPLFSVAYRTANFEGVGAWTAGDASLAGGSRGWRVRRLRTAPGRGVPPARETSREGSARRKSRRAADRTADKNQAGHQSESGPAAEHFGAVSVSAPCGRGDRVRPGRSASAPERRSGLTA